MLEVINRMNESCREILGCAIFTHNVQYSHFQLNIVYLPIGDQAVNSFFDNFAINFPGATTGGGNYVTPIQQ